MPQARDGSASKISKLNGSCGSPGIAEPQLGIRESRPIKNAELALGDPGKAFRATVSASLYLENPFGVGPVPSPVDPIFIVYG